MDERRAAGMLMGLTYASGTAGVVWGMGVAFTANPDLRWPCFLAVGISGILSWVRHSVLHRGDALRMGWDTGTTNPFQIEVGLANLAWGLFAILAVLLSWGLAAYAAAFLVNGIYMAAVGIYKAIRAANGQQDWRTVFAAASWGVVMIIIGAAGMAALP